MTYVVPAATQVDLQLALQLWVFSRKAAVFECIVARHVFAMETGGWRGRLYKIRRLRLLDMMLEVGESRCGRSTRTSRESDLTGCPKDFMDTHKEDRG